MFPKQRETTHCSAAGKATKPKKEIAMGHTRQIAPYSLKKKFHARIMAQNSRVSLDLKGTRQLGITNVSVKINVDK